MSPFLTDEVSPELSPSLSPSPSQGNTAPQFYVHHNRILKNVGGILILELVTKQRQIPKYIMPVLKTDMWAVN